MIKVCNRRVRKCLARRNRTRRMEWLLNNQHQRFERWHSRTMETVGSAHEGIAQAKREMRTLNSFLRGLGTLE